MPALPAAFTEFRTCYQHPAGRVGAALTARLESLGWLNLVAPPAGTPAGRGGVPVLGGFSVTDVGRAEFARLGIIVPSSVRRDVLYKACADYTVRLADGRRGVPHIGGVLGAALTQWLLSHGYAERLATPQSVYERRTLVLTAAGAAVMNDLGIPGTGGVSVP